MPATVAARYTDADGSQHRVVVEWASRRSWRVLDCTDTATVVIETLGGDDDGLPQADALARDYAAEHEDVRRGRRDPDPPRSPDGDGGSDDRPWAD